MRPPPIRPPPSGPAPQSVYPSVSDAPSTEQDLSTYKVDLSPDHTNSAPPLRPPPPPSTPSQTDQTRAKANSSNCLILQVSSYCCLSLYGGQFRQYSMAEETPVEQRQTAVTAYFPSNQLLLFVFALRCRFQRRQKFPGDNNVHHSVRGADPTALPRYGSVIKTQF